MPENLKSECLFIGGSADGKWLEVDPTQLEHRFPSFSQLPAMLDSGPRPVTDRPVPDSSVAIEVYRRIEVEHETGEAIAYALNGLTEDAITVQLMKHFGSAESAPMM